MSDTKQTWRLIVKETGEVVIKSEYISGDVKRKSLELMDSGEDSKYQIQYFEDYKFKGTDKLDVYFSQTIES